MTVRDVSKLKLYSLGIVLVTKKPGDPNIMVIPIEDMSLVEGDKKKYILPQVYKYEVSLPDAKGVVKKDPLTGNNVLNASWIPFHNTNRTSAPDVVKNETVLIYQYADRPDYYWTSVFNEPHLRRLETVVHQYGNLKSGLDPWDASSSYMTKISTHEQVASYTTCKSNGEEYEYTIEVDSGNSTVTIKDDDGNSIILDSPSGTVTIETNDYIKEKTDHIENTAALDIISKTKKISNFATIYIKNSTDQYETTAKTHIKETAPLIEMTANKECKLTTPKYTIKANTTATGEFKIIGSLTVTGPVKITGSLTTSGSISCSGLTSNGNIKVKGTVIASNFVRG